MGSLRELLTFAEFPGIVTGSDEEFNRIISPENRQYLLAWTFEQLYPGESLWASGAAKVEELAELLYQNGFCTSSTKLKFATGEQSLNADLQMEILKKIFNVLTLTRNSENKPASETSIVMSLEEFESVLQSIENVNIFPDLLGPSYTRTEEERNLKIAEYKAEIKSLKNEISNLEESEKLNIDYDVSNKEVNLEKIELLEERIVNFKECMGEIYGTKAVEFNVDQEGLRVISGECRGIMENLIQQGNNLQTISNFSESLSLITDKPGKSYKTIERLVKISSEIANVK